MYERVPRNKPALQQHLTDPVIEYIPLYRGNQEHYLHRYPCIEPSTQWGASEGGSKLHFGL